MKRLLSLICIVTLFSGSFIFVPKTETKADSIKHIQLTLTPSYTKVKIKWPKKKKVSYFKIYKVKIGKKTVSSNGYTIKKKKFKLLKKIAGNKKSFTDKAVKENKEYAYYIEGYNKNGLKYTSYTDSYLSTYVGLSQPTITTYYSDNYTNGAHHVYFHVYPGNGIAPKKFMIYRKDSGDSKYKQIKLKPFVNSDDDPSVYCDGNLSSNITYKYKVRSYYKKGKKKKYSKYSSVYKVTPCNEDAKFDISTVTPAGTNIYEFVIKLTGDFDNGKTTFYYQTGSTDDTYSFTDLSNNNYKYLASVSEYSLNGTTWNSLKNSPFTTVSSETFYLKIKLSKMEDDTTPNIIFGGAGEKSSVLELTSPHYSSPNSGSTNVSFDLTKGKGTAYVYND